MSTGFSITLSHAGYCVNDVEKQLWASIEKHCHDTPRFKPRSAWAIEIQQEIAAAAR